MLRIHYVLLVLIAAVLFPLSGRGQVFIDKDQPDLPLDAKARAEVIDKVLKELADNYVFPEVADKMVKAVRRRVKDKEYDAIKTGQELARRLTEHLQGVSRDKHLRVVCSSIRAERLGASDLREARRSRQAGMAPRRGLSVV